LGESSWGVGLCLGGATTLQKKLKLHLNRNYLPKQLALERISCWMSIVKLQSRLSSQHKRKTLHSYMIKDFCSWLSS
jgi:hypothetical protein